MRRFYDLLPEAERAGIGHNGGPPLDMSYKAWMWRKAHAKAWQSPGRETVLRRLRQAEWLGLSYEAYNSVILDRGARLSGLIVMLDRARLKDAAVKLAKHNDCCRMLCLEDGLSIPDPLRAMAAHVAEISGQDIPAAVRGLVKLSRLSPSAIFMVGSEKFRRTAENAGLGLFVEDKVYFAQ